MIKPQSIRKGVNIYLNRVLVEKQTIIELSKEWTSTQEILFKRLLKEGGEINIKGVNIKVLAQEKLLTSRGEKDSGIIVAPGSDTRF
jgi:hypothetical protein